MALIGWAEGWPAWSLPAGGVVLSFVGFFVVFVIGTSKSELVSNGLHFKAYGAKGKYWLRRQRHGPIINFSIGAVVGAAAVSIIALGVALFAEIPPNESTIHAAGAITAVSGLIWAIRGGIWRRRGVHNYAVIDPARGVLILPTDPTGSPDQGLEVPIDAVTAVEPVDLGAGSYDKEFKDKQGVRLRWQAPTGFERRALVVEYATDDQATELAGWLRSRIDRGRAT